MRRTTSTRSGASSSRRPAESSGSRRRFPCRWRSSREGKSPRRDSWISSARAPRGSSDSRRRDPSGREPTPTSRSWTRRRSGSSGNRTSGPNQGTAPSSDGRCGAGRSPSSAGDASRTPSSRGSTRMPERNAILALADGTLYRGTAFGHIGESGGEVVFNTGMTGYQEGITDPSYKGQMVTMTSPEIGNTGINPDDGESLDGYLRRYHVCGISGVDTRALTRRLRDGGSQMGIISSVDLDEKRLVRKAKDLPPIVGRDLVREVTSARETRWETGDWDLGKGYLPASEYRIRFGRIPKVVAIDYGIKQNILRMLVSRGMEVTLVPSETTASAILSKR